MRRARTLSALTLGLTLVGPLTLVPTAQAAFPGDNGLIAFVGQYYDIYTIEADGSNLTNLTNTPWAETQPAWSPDGSKIAFRSGPPGTYEIFVMDADGSNITQLTDSPGTYSGAPTWSPDGSTIAFERTPPSGGMDIYSVPATGGPVSLLVSGGDGPAYSPDGTRLAYAYGAGTAPSEIFVRTLSSGATQQITWNSVHDFEPEWSPDGTMLAVTRTPDGGWTSREVWIVEAHGYNEDLLAGPSAMSPSWSPDGSRVVFVEYKGESNADLASIPPVPGSTPTPLTSMPGWEQVPNWQPVPSEAASDELIAFTSGRDGNPEIYVMGPGGEDQTRLTTNSAMDDYAAISPDGTQIAFTSWRDGDAEIYLMDADGSNVTQLTSNGGYDAEPTWSPGGEAVMFVSDRSGSSQLWFTVLDPAMTFGPYGPGGTVSNFSPDWSSQGVAYVSDEDGDNDIYSFIPDGTVTTQLTDDPASDHGPDWSPSPPDAIHHHVLFVRGAPGEGDIWDYWVEGDSETQVIDTPNLWESSPSHRLDATFFAFARATPGDLSSAQVWSMDMEGGLHQLTTSAGGNYSPDWGPCTLDAEGLCGVVPVPPPVKHARAVTLNLKPDDLVASGKVTCEDGFAACRLGVPVRIERKSPKGWKLVVLVQTNENGKYKKDLPDEEGTYRAVAKKIRLNSDLCGAAISDKVGWGV